jgi:two-component system, NarL family, response regulator NreC
MSIRVLLVDDHELMREGLRAILERETDVEVIGEAQSGREAVEQVRALAPDLVIMDVAMKDMNGIEATRQIRATSEGVRVVALSSHSDRRYVSAILAAGASGYVLKANAYDDLLRAVRAAMRGGSYLSPDVAGSVIEAATASRPSDASVYALLGPREREVLQLLAEGLTSRQIAARLHLSPVTVESHRRNLMSKLGIHSVAELTKYAVREGLTSLDDR